MENILLYHLCNNFLTFRELVIALPRRDLHRFLICIKILIIINLIYFLLIWYVKEDSWPWTIANRAINLDLKLTWTAIKIWLILFVHTRIKYLIFVTVILFRVYQILLIKLQWPQRQHQQLLLLDFGWWMIKFHQLLLYKLHNLEPHHVLISYMTRSGNQGVHLVYLALIGVIAGLPDFLTLNNALKAIYQAMNMALNTGWKLTLVHTEIGLGEDVVSRRVDACGDHGGVGIRVGNLVVLTQSANRLVLEEHWGAVHGCRLRVEILWGEGEERRPQILLLLRLSWYRAILCGYSDVVARINSFWRNLIINYA